MISRGNVVNKPSMTIVLKYASSVDEEMPSVLDGFPSWSLYLHVPRSSSVIPSGAIYSVPEMNIRQKIVFLCYILYVCENLVRRAVAEEFRKDQPNCRVDLLIPDSLLTTSTSDGSVPS